MPGIVRIVVDAAAANGAARIRSPRSLALVYCRVGLPGTDRAALSLHPRDVSWSRRCSCCGCWRAACVRGHTIGAGRERFGFFDAPGFSGSLWVHAVSVGEVNAAEPLIKALRRDYPNAPLVITTVTPTGSARVHQLFGDSVFHVYLPYDLPYRGAAAS